MAFTSKHALPNDSHTKEILLRRHTSIRRSLRPGSFQSAVSSTTLTTASYSQCSTPLFIYVISLVVRVRKWEVQVDLSGMREKQIKHKINFLYSHLLFIIVILLLHSDVILRWCPNLISTSLFLLEKVWTQNFLTGSKATQVSFLNYPLDSQVSPFYSNLKGCFVLLKVRMYKVLIHTVYGDWPSVWSSSSTSVGSYG